MLYRRRQLFLELSQAPVKLIPRKDNYVYNGDQIRLQTFGSKKFLSALPRFSEDCGKNGESIFGDHCELTASENNEAISRNVFNIYRAKKHVPNSVPLAYGEPVIFTLYSANKLNLYSELRSPLNCSLKSHQQNVYLKEDNTVRAQWKILYKNSEYRLEHEGLPITINSGVIVNHRYTNQNLAFEEDHIVWSEFGAENEISGHTCLNVQKVEKESNVWLIR